MKCIYLQGNELIAYEVHYDTMDIDYAQLDINDVSVDDMSDAISMCIEFVGV